MARFESNQQGLRELGRTPEMGRAMERVARSRDSPSTWVTTASSTATTDQPRWRRSQHRVMSSANMK